MKAAAADTDSTLVITGTGCKLQEGHTLLVSPITHTTAVPCFAQFPQHMRYSGNRELIAVVLENEAPSQH